MPSYSRSRGLFAGISLEGATVRPDEETNKELYGREATNREILTASSELRRVAGKFERGVEPGLGATQPIGPAFGYGRE